MAWLAVIVAGLLEVVFATMLKLSENFSRVWPTVGFAVAAVLSFSLLSWSLKVLPIGTAYAVWTGIGAAGTAAVGMLVFDDPATLVRIGGIAMIIGGVVLLNVGGTAT
ncbi:MAG TPA: multidrug efflux SMR transporter [Motilibacterales bacterium]|nr:multidrug efflux SMR transporter [Motilibacterales bacterium]